MKTPVVEVLMWGKPIGLLSWNNELDIAVFEYNTTFSGSGIEVSPIMMPLSQDRKYYFTTNKGNCFKGLPGLIADSLPDDFGSRLIDEWFAVHNENGHPTPLDRLCYVGKRGMGALEFKPSTKIDENTISDKLYISELTELARQVLNDREGFQTKIKEADTGVRELLKIGTSAGGAKPKAIIAYNEKTGDIRSGQVDTLEGYGYWLVKFDGVAEKQKIRENPKGIGAIEYAYYLMALDCDISMSESRLMNDGEYRHFMTRRFDRSETGEKLHTQTLAALAHFDRDLPHSYEEAFSVMRLMGLSIKEQKEFYTRMVFNVIARNNDDHTKNHSFIMNKSGEWRLAPAYDLCYNYSASSRWISMHQLSLNGKREGFTVEDLLSVGIKMEIPEPQRIIEKVNDVVAGWDDYAKKADVPAKYIETIKKNLWLCL